MNIAARMERMRDEDLVQIANGKGSEQFEADFVEAAKTELRRRRLTDAEVGELNARVEELAAFEEAQKDAPLSWPARIAFMLFGFTTIGLLFAVAQRYLGYPRKSSDAFVWTLYGLAFWGLVAFGFAISDASA